MAGYLTPLLAILVIVVAANALPQKNAKYNPRRWIVGGRRHHGLVPKPNRKEKFVVKSAVADQMDQLVDHFNPANKNTFRQRYWFNNVYYKRGGPAFLMLGGEGEESADWVEYAELHFMKMAKSHNAMVFLLEHRYYGYSRPTKDMSTANLQYLSSEQGLEDAAAFIKKMNAQFNFTNTKWITFGGSYSGALSGWMREKYPNLVSGAVATSAPVLAEVDFVEYLEVVQTALTTYSPACALNVKRGMAEVQRLMASAAGRKTLEKTFSLCHPIIANSSDDVKYFYEAVIGNYMGVVQYSGDNAGYYRNALTIPKICGFHMTNATTPLEQLGQVNSYLMGYNQEDCVYISYAGWIEYAKQTSFDATSAATRAWLWQTCTEFGYYQSTDSKTAGLFFGAVWPVNYYVKQCAEIYGPQYNNATVYGAVAKSNSFYGGRDHFTGTQVVLPNGSNDPWHALGILTSKHPDYTAVVIKGTSHCADMYAADYDDVPALTIARETIEMQVATWLSH